MPMCLMYMKKKIFPTRLVFVAPSSENFEKQAVFLEFGRQKYMDYLIVKLQNV